MGITAKDHRAVFQCGCFVEERVGIPFVLPITQQIDLHGHTAALSFPADLAHIIQIDPVRHVEMSKVRVGEVGKQACIHSIHGLADILAEILLPI